MPAGRLFLAVQSEKLILAGPQTPPEANRIGTTLVSTLYQGEGYRLLARLVDGSDISLRLPGNHAGRQMLHGPITAVTLALHSKDMIVVPEALTSLVSNKESLR
ncbi:TOBE domain-containing protein [Paenirhodobacter sp.]|uniref:TOBE domain-containing protein n=1 Tax=Paenirhodobacter sp. TaxID=1965326 RepID=UPI003B3CD2BD